MGRAINSSENWLTANFQKIIDCPYQPGNLKISKNACQKRYETSRKTSFEIISRADLFTYTVGQGLLRCQHCPIVKGMPDQALNVPLSHFEDFSNR